MLITERFFIYSRSHFPVHPRNFSLRKLNYDTISRLGETRPEQEWSNGTEFSAYSDFPEKMVHSKRIYKFSKTFPGIFTVYHSVSDRKSQNFWSNGKRPRARRYEALGTRFETESRALLD